MKKTFSVVFASALVLLGSASAEDHSHHTTGVTHIEPPTVFLDKSPRIVEYQLKRLENQRLLLVERSTDDPKYIPVYEAILGRDGMTPQFREEAVDALAKLRGSDRATELMSALAKLDADDRQSKRPARVLASMLLKQPPESLAAHTNALAEATDSDNAFLRSVGYAGLIVAGESDAAWEKAERSQESRLAWLAGIPLLPKPELRSQQRDKVAGLVTDGGGQVCSAAITAIAWISAQQGENFELVAPFLKEPALRGSAVRTLLKIPPKFRGASSSEKLAAQLVEYAEKTPPAKRTSDDFIDAMQLADQLLAKVPSKQAKEFRRRLSDVTVRVVKLHTVEEEMRYDTPYFAVEAGRPVQIVLVNEDLMPHNLVVTVPGKLKEVANLGLQVGSAGGWKGLPYVPESELVLAATKMVQPNQSDRITFDAPSVPGEYPYVCTFPQHWYRMYGVMVVVEDLEQWNKNPVEPANPIGSNRSFVSNWTVDHLKDELDGGLRGRSPEIGEKIFVEASCKGCHKVNRDGGVIGPELTDLFARWKGDRVGVLREILNPSHKVDAKYQMHQVLTADGRVVTGIIVGEDDDNVKLLENPEAKDPTVIAQDDIDEMIPSRNSMMPKALMDQYTKDEIFELMAYLESINPAP